MLEIFFCLGYNIIYSAVRKEEKTLKQEKINRINELAKKARETELSAEEIAERDALRQEYLAAVRQNFRKTLESIEIVDKEQ